MIYTEDMTIDKKYLNVFHVPIYDTHRKMHGIIREISLVGLSNGLYIQYYAYYDSVNNRDVLFTDDFKKGTIKFVLFTDEEYQKGIFREVQDSNIEAIKEFLGDAYSEDSIIWISGQERKDHVEAQNYREKKKIGDSAKWAESATNELIFESYSAMKIFCLYTDKVITKEQFLIELVNILAEEKRVQRDMRLNEGVKSLRKDIEDVFAQNKDFFREIFKGE